MRPEGWVGLAENMPDSVKTECRGTRTIATKGHYERLGSSVQALSGTQRPSNQTITQGPVRRGSAHLSLQKSFSLPSILVGRGLVMLQ